MSKVAEDHSTFNTLADTTASSYFMMLDGVRPGKKYDANHPFGTDLINSLARNRIHLIRVSTEPLQFVICRESLCASLKDPFSGRSIQENEFSDNRNYGLTAKIFYVSDPHEVSIAFNAADYSAFPWKFQNDPFTSSAMATGARLPTFLSENYFDDNVLSIIARTTSVDSKIEGAWVFKRVTFDPTEVCSHANTRNDLVSD